MKETNKNSLITPNGISFQRLINKENYTNFLDIIQCKICFNILKNPYDCSSCGNSFCYNCISNLLLTKKNCPFNCENFSIKPSSYGIISYLSKLNFNCKNKDYGCNEIISYQNLDIHEKECKYFYTICPNGQCNKKILWDSLENHLINECPYSLLKCKICNQNFNRSDFEEHEKNCKNLKKFSISINKSNKDDIKKHKANFENLINNLPSINDSSNLTFMKMILYQFNLNNQIIYNKIEELKNDIKLVHNDIKVLNQNNIFKYDKISKEVKHLNKKFNELHNFSFQNIGSPIPQSKYSDNDSLLSTGEIAQNFLNNPITLDKYSEKFIKKDNNVINNKNDIINGNLINQRINFHKKYESTKLPDKKFGDVVCEGKNEDDKDKIISLKKIGSLKVNNNLNIFKDSNGKEIKPYSKPFVSCPKHRRTNSRNLLLDKLNYIIKIIEDNCKKIINDISNNQQNSLDIILANLKNLDQNWDDEIIYPKLTYNYNINTKNKLKNDK